LQCTHALQDVHDSTAVQEVAQTMPSWCMDWLC
jgi:hypothetical protein